MIEKSREKAKEEARLARLSAEERKRLEQKERARALREERRNRDWKREEEEQKAQQRAEREALVAAARMILADAEHPSALVAQLQAAGHKAGDLPYVLGTLAGIDVRRSVYSDPYSDLLIEDADAA